MRVRFGWRFRAGVVIVLLALIIIGEWAWWESYKSTVDWGKRKNPFPSPFYLWWWPNWFWVDFAITLILTAAVCLAILALLEPQTQKEVKKNEL